MRWLSLFGLTISVLGLSLYSSIFVYSSRVDSNSDLIQVVNKMNVQLLSYGLGLSLFFAISRVPYRKWLPLALPFYMLNLLALLLLPFFGTARKGALSWYDLGPTDFQPSETMKTAWLLYLASWLRYRKNLDSFFGILPAFVITGIPMLLVFKQPDFGTASLYIPTLFGILFLNGVKKRHLGTILSVALIACIPIYMFVLKDYQKARVLGYWDRESHKQTTAYQLDRSMMAIGEGAWIGKGVGKGRVNEFNLLPESDSDFIFATVAEERGFIGASLLISLYLILFFSCLSLGACTREPFGRSLALGMGLMMTSQAMINLGVVLGLLPTTGITLPFVSSGGSSFLSCCIMMGIVLSVSRYHVPVLSKDDFRHL
jgi:rod shape determining protein RodA